MLSISALRAPSHVGLPLEYAFSLEESRRPRAARVSPLMLAKEFLRTIFEKLRSWWRSVPQKTRVQLIASVLLIFAGTEVFVLAPYIFDIALIIDVGGLVVVIAAFRSSISVSMMQLRSLATILAQPLFLCFRIGRLIGDFGTPFPPTWYRYYFFVDRLSTRCSAAFLFVAVGLVLTNSFIGKP